MASARKLAGALAGGLALAAVPAVARAQTGTVTGRVVDSTSRLGIVGVSVRVDGTTLGTQTRADGGFTIAGVPAGARTLRLQRIGFRAQTVAVDVRAGGTATANAALAAVAAQLTEVVAVAYSSGGAQDRRNVVGSVAAVDSSQFNKGRVLSAEDLIQAKVAGVQVVSSNEPGGGITVRVRGQSSINGVNDPLFVIDGIPLPIGGGLSGGRNPLNFLNPQDIANITVLKDAQATAIYGSRGSNGVVLVTTKNGTQGGTQVTYGVNYSNRQVARRPDLLNADQLRAAVTQFAPQNVALLNQTNANTDWFDALTQTGGGQEHNLAVGGVRQDLAYRLSVGYTGDASVLRGDRTNRVSGQFNYTDRLFKNALDVQATLRGVRTRDNFGGSRFLGDALGSAPTRPIFNPDGSFFATPNVLENRNPLANLALQRQDGRTDRGLGNLQLRAQAPFLKGLSATVRGSFDAARTRQTEFTPTTAPGEAFNQDTLRGRFYQNLPDATTLVLDAFGNYTARTERLGGTDVDVTAGYSYENFRANNASFTVRGLTSNALGVNGVPASFVRELPAPNVQIAKLVSFFGRANFTAADRYLLGLSVRQDASSRFGPNNESGIFPSVALGWRLLEEPVFKARVRGLSDLKLRYSWGVTGNQPGNDRLGVQFSTFGYSNPFSQVQFGNTFIPFLTPSTANPNLRWEQTTTHNAGLDYGMFGGRVTGTVDYYRRTTNNLLFDGLVASGTNFNNRLLQNVGALRNAGVEFGINAAVLQGRGEGLLGRLRYDANFNAATNRNRVLRTTGVAEIPTGQVGLGGQFIQVLRPGLPVNAFRVLQARRDANGNPITGPQTVSSGAAATAFYVDQNGDGRIDAADEIFYKNPLPRWILGHTSQFGLGRADFNFTLRSNLGAYLYNRVAAEQGNFAALQQGGVLRNLNAAALRYNFVQPQFQSDLYVERADFLRMENITLGYQLPAYRGLRNTRVFGTVQNAFTLTGYSGIDPLSGGVGGIDNNTIPLQRIVTIGLNVGF